MKMDQTVLCKPSFASVVRHQQQEMKQENKTNPTTVPPCKYNIVIRSKNSDDDAEQVKQLLKTHLKPDVLKIGVKNLKKTKSGQIVMELDSDESKNTAFQFINGNTTLSSKVTAEKPKKLNPRLKVHDVPRDLNNADLINVLYNQNNHITMMYSSPEDFGSDCVIIRKIEHPKYETDTVIVEVSPELRNIFLSTGRVNLKWTRVKVTDFLQITRCYNCCGFRHVKKHCKDELRCGRCAGPHKYSDCTEKEKTPCCANCSKRNARVKTGKLQTDHEAYDPKCPSLSWMKLILSSNIQYE